MARALAHPYTFSFQTAKGEKISVTHNITDEILLGIGFGVYIYNDQKHLPQRHESIHVDGNVNLVEEFMIESIMPDGWTLDEWLKSTDEDEVEEPLHYVIKYSEIYINFNTRNFMQGVYTAFQWLEVPEMKELTKKVYDTESNIYLTVN